MALPSGELNLHCRLDVGCGEGELSVRLCVRDKQRFETLAHNHNLMR